MSCCEQSTDGGGSTPSAAAECEAVVSPTGLSTLDSTIIQTALDGPQQTVCLRGGTYVLQFGVVVPAGKVLKGANAILQRQPQVTTTTDTALVTGVTTVFVVAAAAGLKVGDDLGFDGGAGNISNATSRITNIVGTTITVSPAVSITDAGPGTLVFTTMFQVRLADDCVLDNVEFDGNEPNNAIGRWQVTGEIELGVWALPGSRADRAVVRNCRVLNTPGEGLMIAGDDVLVDHFVVDSADGNGIHVGNPRTYRCSIRDCHFNDTNNDVAVGHADGCISISLNIRDLLVEGCTFRNTPLAGVGGIDGTTNEQILIRGCEFEACVANAIASVAPAIEVPFDIRVEGCRFQECGPIAFSQVQPAATAAHDLVISGCVMIDTLIAILGWDRVVVADCIVRINDNVSQAITLSECRRAVVEGCVTEDCGYGIIIDGTRTDAVRVVGNVIRNAHNFGIYLGNVPTGPVDFDTNTVEITGAVAATAYAIFSAAGATGPAFSVRGNSVYNDQGGTIRGISIGDGDDTASAFVAVNRIVGCSDRGIWIGGTSVVRDNYIVQTAGRCIDLAGTGALVCQGNTCRRGAAANYAILVQAAGAIARVVNNQIFGNLIDQSGGTAILRDNDALP